VSLATLWDGEGWNYMTIVAVDADGRESPWELSERVVCP